MVTYTNQFISYLSSCLTNSNIGALLINYPELGISDPPTSTELALRHSLTMSLAAAREISLTGNYRRHITSFTSFSVNQASGIMQLSASFIPSTSNYNEATHIIYATNINTSGALPINGNNRGDSAGTIILIETLDPTPVSLYNGVTFTHSTTINFVA